LIKVKNLTKRYGDLTAVNNISFNIEDGHIYGLLGANGAGKSTTMNMITGCLAPTSGSITVGGHDIASEPEKAKALIGYLPELPPLYTDMTPREYLSFIASARRMKSDEAEDHIEEIIKKTKISGVADKLIKDLSKGYRQRVGIAQALIGNPKVLIFDEPTVGLDPKQIIEIRNLIRVLGKQHTVILSTHILPEVQAVCDRIVVINKGEIVANERTQDLVNAVDGSRKLMAKIVGPENDVIKALKGLPGVKYAEVLGKRDTDSTSYLIESEDKIDIRKPLFSLLSRNGWYLIGLEGMELNLEDIFIRLTEKRKEKENRKTVKRVRKAGEE